MSQQASVNETLNFIPSGYSSANSDYSSISSSYPISNGYDDTSSSTYAYITCNTGSDAETYISYTFDVSNIPNNATIESVSCSVKVRVSSTSYISTAESQLYCGSTAKGSSTSTRSTSATTYALTPGTWTRNELDDIQIRFTGTRSSKQTSRSAYLYFYGAELSVTYSITGTQYTLTAVTEVSDTTITPLAANVLEGESQEFTIDLGSVDINDVTLTDNNVDVTNSLIVHEVYPSGTVESVPSSYEVSGSINGTRYQSTIGCSVDNPSSQTGNDYSSSSGSTAIIYYKFNFDDIPDTATISSMTVQAYGHLESTSSSSEQADLATYYGTTQKGSTVSYTTTSSQLITIPSGSWTVAELKDDARVGFTIGYYGGLTTGITWTVEYAIPSGSITYYYTYTVSNMADDHSIILSSVTAYIPPEEDPEKTYYPVTISTINATTNPTPGTNRVEAGTTETITITPSETQVTLILDNGVDVSSQLVSYVSEPTYTIDDVSGASYGFELNSSTGYYVSQNEGVSSSAALARINLDLPGTTNVTITYINYAEATYDYGIFGNVDSALSTSYSADSNVKLACSSSSDNSEYAQTLTYQVEAGQHFIDVKYRKDTYTDSNNDNLQFKVSLTSVETTTGYYTYTLNNINQSHNLIFIFGDVQYYFITSTGSNSRLYPNGQVVVLDGGNYKLTIVPDNYNSTVSITDNGVNVTNLLETLTGTDKTGNEVVSYNYYLSNISAAHNLVVSFSAENATLYLKINGSWTTITKAYKKENGSWVEQDITNLFSDSINYVLGG